MKAYETASLIREGAFAAKPIHKRGVPLSTTQPFDGSINGEFRESTEGAATFKLKVPDNSTKKSESKPQKETILMTNEAL